MNSLRNLIPSPLRPAAKRIRSLLRSLSPTVHQSPLSVTDCRAEVYPDRAVAPIECGRSFFVPLTVVNHAPATISPLGPFAVGVQVLWKTHDGKESGMPAGFAPLPRPLFAGEGLKHTFSFPCPTSLGDYQAEFAVVQRGGPAFERVGRRTPLDIHVTHPYDGNFNYHQIYSQSDLSRDFWTASGPGTKAEFDRLVPIKLNLLKDLGLTPDSKLLDIGCGTGLLATAAEGFLSDRGLYYGTDLAKEAVEFCQQHYRRPNFRFCVNGMTDVPIDGIAFDMAVFFSVFTHTYADESAFLLAEAKRLLTPNGVIFADVFTSPLVAREAGSRYAVEVNRQHFLKLVNLVGLKAEVVMSSPWQGKASREFFKFTRK
jgi:SAM-dependent methyltransferase